MVTPGTEQPAANGAAMAALLGAGIGAFAVGAIAILAAADWIAVPALYGPAGGVSGRTTAATVLWLIAWGLLHRHWRARQLDAPRVQRIAVILTVLGVLLTLPPLWELL